MSTADFLSQDCPLFCGIAPQNTDALLSCLAAKNRNFPKGAYIFAEGDAITQVGVVLNGLAQVVKDDFWGNRVIISQLGAGDVFGEVFASRSDNAARVSVVAADACSVLLLNFNKIVTSCPSSCGFHSLLIKNMLKILADKNALLTEKIELVTRKSTREKVLAYLSSVAKQQSCNEITIPFDRQALADYLSVDRSALSHELSMMKNEGLIDYRKNRFLLFERSRTNCNENDGY